MSFEDALVAATNVENRFRGMQRSPNMYRPGSFGSDKASRMAMLDAGDDGDDGDDRTEYNNKMTELDSNDYTKKAEAFLERGTKIQDEPFLKIMEIILPESVYASLTNPNENYTLEQFVKAITESSDDENVATFALLLPDYIDDDDDVNVKRVKPILKDIYSQMMKAGRRGMNTYIRNLYNQMERQRNGTNSGMKLAERNKTRWCLYVHLEAIQAFLTMKGGSELASETAREIDELTVVLGPAKVLPHLKHAMKTAGMTSMMSKLQNFCNEHWKKAQTEWATHFVVDGAVTPPHITLTEYEECNSKLHAHLCSIVKQESDLEGSDTSFPFQVKKGSTKVTPKWENTFLIPYEPDRASGRKTWSELLNDGHSDFGAIIKSSTGSTSPSTGRTDVQDED